MKKLMISTSVLVGVAVLGGGYLLWPNGSQKATPVATTDTSSAVTKKVTSSVTKSAATHDSSQPASSSAAKVTPATGTSASSSSASAVKQTTTAVATTNGTATNNQLTTAQINDWVWQQLAAEYQGTKTTKADFGFNQTKKSDGLVYIEARETGNDQVSHLAGLFRVNANGQLEKQDTAKGADVWDVVSQTYK